MRAWHKITFILLAGFFWGPPSVFSEDHNITLAAPSRIQRCYYFFAHMAGMEIPLRWQSPRYFVRGFPKILLDVAGKNSREVDAVGAIMSHTDLAQVQDYLRSERTTQLLDVSLAQFLINRFARAAGPSEAFKAIQSDKNILNAFKLLNAYDREHNSELWMAAAFELIEKIPQNSGVAPDILAQLLPKVIASKDKTSLRIFVDHLLKSACRSDFGALDPPVASLKIIFDAIGNGTKEAPPATQMMQLVRIFLNQARESLRRDKNSAASRQRSIESIFDIAIQYFRDHGEGIFMRTLSNEREDILKKARTGHFSMLIEAFNKRRTGPAVQDFLRSGASQTKVSWRTWEIPLQKTQRMLQEKVGKAIEISVPEKMNESDFLLFLNSELIPEAQTQGFDFIIIPNIRNANLINALRDTQGFSTIGIPTHRGLSLFRAIDSI